MFVVVNAGCVSGKYSSSLIWALEVVDVGCALPNGITTTSPYIGLNFLSVNENLVICDKNQTHLRKELDKHGIESIGLEMRHARAMAGGFHCVTLDTKRKGKRQDYFN